MFAIFRLKRIFYTAVGIPPNFRKPTLPLVSAANFYDKKAAWL